MSVGVEEKYGWTWRPEVIRYLGGGVIDAFEAKVLGTKPRLLKGQQCILPAEYLSRSHNQYGKG